MTSNDPRFPALITAFAALAAQINLLCKAQGESLEAKNSLESSPLLHLAVVRAENRLDEARNEAEKAYVLVCREMGLDPTDDAAINEFWALNQHLVDEKI